MDNPNSNPLKLEPHDMLALFMALATCGGGKSNFSTIYFQAFEIFPMPFILEMDYEFRPKPNSLQGPTSCA
jgi:hypothetical protein